MTITYTRWDGSGFLNQRLHLTFRVYTERRGNQQVLLGVITVTIETIMLHLQLLASGWQCMKLYHYSD